MLSVRTRPAELRQVEGEGGADRWLHLVPSGAQVTRLHGSWLRLRRLGSAASRLPSGAPVVLLADRPGARRAARYVAARAGLVIEREFIALPSLRSAMFVVEDDQVSVEWMCQNVLAVPPGYGQLTLPMDVAIRVARGRLPWSLLGAVAPGRVLVGRRP